MALRFIDGFDHYMTADLNRKWSLVSDGNVTIAPEYARPGSQGQGCIGLNANATRWAKTLDDQATLIVGFAFQFLTQTTSQIIIVLRDSTGTEQCSLRSNASSLLQFTKAGTIIPGTSASVGALSTATWYHVEIKVTIGNTGAVECRLNGVAVIGPTTSVDTQTSASETTARQIAIFTTNGGGSMYIDDVIMADATGGVNDSFIGPARIITRRPNGTGSTTQWIPAGYSDNYANVQDEFYDGDNGFNQSSTAGDTDLYGLEDVPPGTIIGVQTNIWARQDAGAGRTIRPVWYIGSTEYPGTTIGVAGSYLDYMQVYDKSPATAAAWTDTEINGAEIGVELVA